MNEPNNSTLDIEFIFDVVIYRVTIKSCFVKVHDELSEIRKFILRLIEAYSRQVTIEDLEVLGLSTKAIKSLLIQLKVMELLDEVNNKYSLTSKGTKAIESKEIPRYILSDYSFYAILEPFIYKIDPILFEKLVYWRGKEADSKIDFSNKTSWSLENLLVDDRINPSNIIKSSNNTTLEVKPIGQFKVKIKKDAERFKYKICNTSNDKQEHKIGYNIDKKLERTLANIQVQNLRKSLARVLKNNIKKVEIIPQKGLFQVNINNYATIHNLKVLFEESIGVNYNSKVLITSIKDKTEFWKIVTTGEKTSIKILLPINSNETENNSSIKINNLKASIPVIFNITTKEIASEVVKWYIFDQINSDINVIINPKKSIENWANNFWKLSGFYKQFGDLALDVDDKLIEDLTDMAFNEKLFGVYKWLRIRRDFND